MTCTNLTECRAVPRPLTRPKERPAPTPRVKTRFQKVRPIYRMRPGIKKDPDRRWALPDRIFFGHGACAILAGTYLATPPLPGFYAERIIPGDGFAGNHIFVTDGCLAFDYHGYSIRKRLLDYHAAKWSGETSAHWTCRLERVRFDLLDTRALNDRKMLGPEHYKKDVIARAQRYLARIDHEKAYAKAMCRSQELRA